MTEGHKIPVFVPRGSGMDRVLVGSATVEGETVTMELSGPAAEAVKGLINSRKVSGVSFDYHGSNMSLIEGVTDV